MSLNSKRFIQKILFGIILVGAFALAFFSLFFNGRVLLFAGPNNSTLDTKTIVESPIEEIQNYDISEFFYFTHEGGSSWYGKRFHMRRTSSGEPFDMNRLSVAHRFLPFGTIVRITNLENGAKVLARVTDRGPFVKNRIIDFSFKTAKELGALGNPKVKIEALVTDQDKFNPEGNYFFGYSYNLPLVCLPDGKFDIVAKFSNFDEAVDFYSKFVQNFPEVFVYLFVPVNISNESYHLSIREYYIGYFPVGKENIQESFVHREE
ncbi:MAG: septal ring lytic transglycosylase RlpA family protein [Candidatus Kapaibacteriales bacterium]